MISEHEAMISLDLETTGLDHRTEQIIEIGAVRLEGGEIVAEFSSLVKPTVPVRHSSFMIHGITDEMLADAPSIEEVLPKFMEFVGDLPYVAHNAIFDYSFLNQAMKLLYDKRFENQRTDTFEMFRYVFPDEASHGLSALLGKFNMDTHVKHRALDDARCLGLAFPHLRKLYEQQKAWQYSQLGNIPYLVERYLRIQKAIHLMQAELSDLREVFKLYFQEGGKPITSTTNEVMVSSYRRNYEYDEATLREIVRQAGLENQVYRINPRAIDRLKDDSDVDLDIRNAIREAMTKMTENRVISFIKAQDFNGGRNASSASSEGGAEEAEAGKELQSS